jgi:signal transduction histidine kinase
MEQGVILFLSLLFIAGTILLAFSFYRLKKTHETIQEQKRLIALQINQHTQDEMRVRELLEEKNQLIGIVSHDLKSPINRIFALTQLIQSQPENLTADQKEYLGKIHQVVADMLAMIRNLLDERKLDTVETELKPELINLSSVVINLAKNFRVLADKKKIKIHTEIVPDAFVNADKHYFLRILENLMSNAIKFSPESRNIYMNLTADGEHVKLRIRDEGPGISEEDQQKMYRKYQQLSARPTGGESTTGLGLAIVKLLTEKMGIGIHCSSVVGEGTAFTLEIKRGVAGNPA